MFLVLTNADLYMYQDIDSETHMEMHVLTPGVFIEELPAIPDEQNLNFNHDQNR